MSQKDEKATSGEIDYAWRPATRGDIGSIARFCDEPSISEIWWYGILTAISHSKPTVYECLHGGEIRHRHVEEFAVCEIQYNPDEAP